MKGNVDGFLRLPLFICKFNFIMVEKDATQIRKLLDAKVVTALFVSVLAKNGSANFQDLFAIRNEGVFLSPIYTTNVISAIINRGPYQVLIFYGKGWRTFSETKLSIFFLDFVHGLPFGGLVNTGTNVRIIWKASHQFEFCPREDSFAVAALDLQRFLFQD